MKIYRLSAFPKSPQGGNKAGVVLDTQGLTDQMMQTIAHTVGYSETAFVFPSTQADFNVRFFTPLEEVDLCGHATIATFNLLRDKGIISLGIYHQETKAGILRLDVQEKQVFMEQNTPVFGETISADELKPCFQNNDFLDQTLPIQIVSTALREIFVPVKSVELLHQLNPDFDAIVALSKQYHVIGVHAFALALDVDAYGRNFAPILGIDEESATGTSNGALASYLAHHKTRKENWILRQGYAMNQPSEIIAKLDITQATINAVWVGGSARILEEEDD
ncbi:PhzF family phenazine biosynthesis protein [Candidatus Xianfuyuplasma coldseepsis]|uniref:PhzF family phenazine biosynthesis protein n=1 Tax=Candidatus Xianfuyuplasma coldseepsis TaxID=2782163 RepID=A0A7L7KS09_9MOLU|nr:PhzF family phenazine biosynthesis protein [Xianfuyuplasma coldseepsis]QMS85385.1 PhzF family phenazine biosynthesis protein [Xianfuyuplasma coldseepsis]